MSTLKKLLDQTTFLLEKQKEARDYTVEAFGNFLKSIQKMQEGKQDQEVKDTLQEIYSAVADQSEQYSAEIEEDIAFLDAQRETVHAVVEEGDAAKSAELARVLTDGQELPETEDFVEEVNEESSEAKRHFLAIMDDLMAALEEENFDDLLVYIQETNIADEGGEEEDECCGGQNEACCGDDAAPKRTECCGGKDDCGNACVCSNECGCA